MNFEFTEEQQQLHETVERYLKEQYPFETFRAIKSSAKAFDPKIWRGLADLGVLAINVPSEQGGLGFGPLETLSIMGAVGSSLLLEPFLSSAVIATTLLNSFRDATAAEQTLMALASGERIAVLAHY